MTARRYRPRKQRKKARSRMTLHSTRHRVRVRRFAAILLPPCDLRSLAVGCVDSTKVADAAPRHRRRRHYSRGRRAGNRPLARASRPLAAGWRPSGRRSPGFAGIIVFRGLPRRSTAGRPALHGREPGQVRKEAATAILCKCRGNGSPPCRGQNRLIGRVVADRARRSNRSSLTPRVTCSTPRRRFRGVPIKSSVMSYFGFR